MERRLNKSARKTLSKQGLLNIARERFEKIKDEVNGRRFDLADYLMSRPAARGRYPLISQTCSEWTKSRPTQPCASVLTI